MIGVIFNSKNEFSEFLKFYNISNEYLQEYPYGEYYQTKINNKDIVFFRSGSKKVYAASSSQYMIDKFNLKKIICIGTCTQINDDLDYNDIIIPEFISEYDLTIREIEPLINENNIIELNIEDIDLDYFKGLLITSDKALVTNRDLQMVKETNALAADTESAAIAKVCMANKIKFICIKGVSDRPMNNYDEQIEVYEENAKNVIKNILQNYLMELI